MNTNTDISVIGAAHEVPRTITEGCASLQAPGWSVGAVAVRGTDHVRAGLPCQDAYRVMATPDGFAACLCDGAGSAANSELGAAAVSDAVCEFLAGRMGVAPACGEVLEVARAAAEAAAARHGGELASYACTMLAVLVDRNRLTTFHLGDGVVVAGVAGRPSVLSAPDRGEYANTTYFVTGERAEQHLRTQSLRLNDTVRSVVIMTDGPQQVLLQSRTGKVSQVVEGVARWHDQVGQVEATGALETAVSQKIAPKVQDDCSLIVARRMWAEDEVAPVICPSCAAWATVGRRRNGRVSYHCPECESVFRKKRTRPSSAPPGALSGQ